MLFSSITFLYFFLPCILLVYYISPRRYRNQVLFLGSLIFYFFGERIYTILLLVSSLSSYIHGIYIEKYRGGGKAKATLISSIIINLALLGFFKYADFFIESVNCLFGANIPLTHVPLPIGISFFTLQTMSYTIDVYRGNAKAERNISTLATYVCLFPQLIAGPVVRYTEISEKLHSRRVTLNDLYIGVKRFSFGLGKVVILANSLAALCGAFRDSGDKSVAFYWIYAISFTLRIYFYFSGYSDMAIGLSRMFGFRLPENFNYPFVSHSITEFWHRWYMTLGSWFEDYLYIPLGGNRVPRWRWYLNIVIVWSTIGLWFGAALNFVVWGLMFGLILAFEKLCVLKLLRKSGKVIPHFYVILIVVLSFVIFGADGMAGVKSDMGGLFGAGGLPAWSFETSYYLKSYVVVLALSTVGSTPLLSKLWVRLCETRTGTSLKTILEPLFVAAVLLICTAYLVDGITPGMLFRF